MLDAAAELIARVGLSRASLASIGELAGGSRGLPNHHFGSKENLIARLAARVQDRLTSSVQRAYDQRCQSASEVDNALDFLRLLVDAYLLRFEHPTSEERALIVMWGETFPLEASVAGMAEAERRGYTGLEPLIECGKKDGSIRADVNTGNSAIMLFGLMRGMAALMLTDAAQIDMAALRVECGAWITNALSAKPSPARQGMTSPSPDQSSAPVRSRRSRTGPRRAEPRAKTKTT